jgi:hypothetical protein
LYDPFYGFILPESWIRPRNECTFGRGEPFDIEIANPAAKQGWIGGGFWRGANREYEEREPSLFSQICHHLPTRFEVSSPGLRRDELDDSNFAE